MLRLVDVGARGGIDPRWMPFVNSLEVLAFEADPAECEALNAREWPYAIRFVPSALGARDGERALLHVCRSPACSSLLEPNRELCAQYPFGDAMIPVGQVEVALTSLESVCRHFTPDVLKVDTQGTELDVLRGAGRLLDDVLAVELEVEFSPQYVGQPLFADVDAFMRGHGFTLRGLRRSYWRTRASHTHAHGGQLVHGDALYLRPDRMNTPKGHMVLAAYRQYDLLASLGRHDLIPTEPVWVRSLARALARLPNREWRRVVDRLRDPSATDWHDPDFF